MAWLGESPLSDYCACKVLVLGCGNALLGDDGFGPAVADHLLENGSLSEGGHVVNAGTSVRQILFDLVLSQVRPQKVIIVDAMDCGLAPGSVTELDLDAIPAVKRDDFSMHQVPTSNLLKELRQFCGVEVRVLVSQPASIPSEVRPGLSPAVRNAVRTAADLVCGLSGLTCPDRPHSGIPRPARQ